MARIANVGRVGAPETRYAESARGRIAYQTVGTGPIDLVVAHGLAIPIDLIWDDPTAARFLDRLSSFCRIIVFDPLGRGSSDPAPREESQVIEGMTEDLTAVIDTIGCRRVALMAQVGPPALLFAASHPERTSGLVLINTTGARRVHLLVTPLASVRPTTDYPDRLAGDMADQMLEEYRRGWGTGAALDAIAPSVAQDERFRRWWGRCERLTSSADDQYWRVRNGWSVDVRPALPTISAPTLVLSRIGTSTEAARFVADHVEGARYVELMGDDTLFFVGETGPMLDEIETFLTGVRPPLEADRVLATVLFTDISSSTKRVSEMGDHEWRGVLDRYRATVREQLHRFRGREINTRGDDFLATFDGPARAVGCAVALIEATRTLGLEVRTGVHVGEVELMGDDIGGIAVHIGARIAELAKAGEILVSRTVVDLVSGSGLAFDDRGAYELKGVPDPWHIFAVRG